MSISALVLILFFSTIFSLFTVSAALEKNKCWFLTWLIPIACTGWLYFADRDCKYETVGTYAMQNVADKDGSIQVIVVDGEIINITKWFGRNINWKSVKVEKEEFKTHGVWHNNRFMRLSDGDAEERKP